MHALLVSLLLISRATTKEPTVCTAAHWRAVNPHDLGVCANPTEVVISGHIGLSFEHCASLCESNDQCNVFQTSQDGRYCQTLRSCDITYDEPLWIMFELEPEECVSTDFDSVYKVIIHFLEGYDPSEFVDIAEEFFDVPESDIKLELNTWSSSLSIRTSNANSDVLLAIVKVIHINHMSLDFENYSNTL